MKLSELKKRVLTDPVCEGVSVRASADELQNVLQNAKDVVSKFHEKFLKQFGFSDLETSSVVGSVSDTTYSDQAVITVIKMNGIKIGTVATTLYVQKFEKPNLINIEFCSYRSSGLGIESEFMDEMRAAGNVAVRKSLTKT